MRRMGVRDDARPCPSVQEVEGSTPAPHTVVDGRAPADRTRTAPARHRTRSRSPVSSRSEARRRGAALNDGQRGPRAEANRGVTTIAHSLRRPLRRLLSTSCHRGPPEGGTACLQMSLAVAQCASGGTPRGRATPAPNCFRAPRTISPRRPIMVPEPAPGGRWAHRGAARQARCRYAACSSHPPRSRWCSCRHDADALDLGVGGNAKAAWTPRLGNVLQEAERRAEQLAASL